MNGEGSKKPTVKIITCSHAHTQLPAHMLHDPYVMVGGGGFNGENMKYTDNSGKNISAYNRHFNEATVIYWAVHNFKEDYDYIGTASYRHWCDFSYDRLDEDTIQCGPVDFDTSVYDQYIKCGLGNTYIDAYIEAFCRVFPEYKDLISEYLHGSNTFYLMNFFLMSRKRFEEYGAFFTKCCDIAVDMYYNMFKGEISGGTSRNDALIDRMPGYVLERITSFWIWLQGKNGVTLLPAKIIKAGIGRVSLSSVEPVGNGATLIVGAGLFGSVVAHELHKRGKPVSVIDRRNTIGGNCCTRDWWGIPVHEYGPHIFNTSDRRVWDYVNSLCQFNSCVYSPIAFAGGRAYNMPFNMNTFYQLWGVKTPDEAMARIQGSTLHGDTSPRNLEEQAISLVGEELYSLLIKGYSEKQWGKRCTDIPAKIIKRIPVRFTFDNNYYDKKYQGIPTGGYTKLFGALLDGITVRLGVSDADVRTAISDGMRSGVHVIWTGAIDEYYGYSHGELEYRGLHFEHTMYPDICNKQGVAVVNYCDSDVPYTRTVEHKHFSAHDGLGTKDLPFTVVTKEYPASCSRDSERFYPVNDDENTRRYEVYADIARNDPMVSFGGRLGSYAYMDMSDTVASALTFVDKYVERI